MARWELSLLSGSVKSIPSQAPALDRDLCDLCDVGGTVILIASAHHSPLDLFCPNLPSRSRFPANLYSYHAFRPPHLVPSFRLSR
jgi:hypothetical protein